MRADEWREPLGEPVRAKHTTGGDDELDVFELQVAVTQLLDVLHPVEHLGGEKAQPLPDVGEAPVAADAMEEGDAEGFFETAHEGADRSLGHVEGGGRAGHVLALGHGDDRVEVVQRHTGPGSVAAGIEGLGHRLERAIGMMGPNYLFDSTNGCKSWRPMKAFLLTALHVT